MELTDVPARSGPQGARSGRSLAPILALTSVAFFMVALDSLVVVTALPAIHASIGGNITTLEWAVNSYALTFAAGIITAAAVGDRLGRRRVYVAGLVLFAAASAACAIAPDAAALIAARAIQGLGAAAVTPLSLTILTSAFPAAKRGSIVGIWGGIGGLAVAGGPLVGGAVVQGLDWHWIFWLNVPIGVTAAILATVYLPESRGPARRLDLPAVPLVAGGAAAIAWALVRGSSAGWGSAEVLAAFAAGAALLAGFVIRERYAAQPMLPLQMMRIRAFAAANATGFLMSGAIFSAAFLTAQYFQLGLGYSPLAAGLRLLPWTATPVLIAPLAGALADRIGSRPLMVTGLVLQALGLAWVAVIATGAGGYGRLVLPLIIAGVGISMALPSTPAAALGAVPPADLGRASGVNNTLQRFGSAFGIAAVTAVFSAYGHLGTSAGVVSGYRPGLVVSAGLSLAGAVTAVAVGRRVRGTVPQAAPAAVLDPVAGGPTSAAGAKARG
ncbi:MAG TPA: DHA2 family efflux MFS transporter permease subunit [Streptosporangiaceae bacterium]|nr:DHA2 family efflux MFS transporter permease subunit [Streptosporangiaceae bacterium]